MRYRIAYGETAFELEESVNSLLKDGAVPLGGVSVTLNAFNKQEFRQALWLPR